MRALLLLLFLISCEASQDQVPILPLSTGENTSVSSNISSSPTIENSPLSQDPRNAVQMPLLTQELIQNETSVLPPPVSTISPEAAVASQIQVSIETPIVAPLPEEMPPVLAQIQSVSSSLETSMSLVVGGGESVLSPQEELVLLSEIDSSLSEKELSKTICSSFSSSLDTTSGIWYTGEDATSIETYWSNQKLFFKVDGVCKRGYYRFTISAKNTKGVLPPAYKFSIDVKNVNQYFRDKKMVGDISITGDSNTYRQGSSRVWLEPGNNIFEVVWKNDIKTEMYDTNISIKKIWLVGVTTDESLLDPLARDGVHFFKNESASWSGDTLLIKDSNSISYSFKKLSGRYKITINTRNTTPTSSFKEFNIKFSNETNETFHKVSSTKDWKTSYTFLQLYGDTKLSLSFINSNGSDTLNLKDIRLESSP